CSTPADGKLGFDVSAQRPIDRGVFGMNLKCRVRFASPVLVALLAGCGGGGGIGSTPAPAPPSPPPPAAPQSQTLSFASASLVAYGGEVLINKATGQGTGLVTYGTDNPAVATVDSQGRITAIGVGKANIAASIAADTAYLAANTSSAIEVIPKYVP